VTDIVSCNTGDSRTGCSGKCRAVTGDLHTVEMFPSAVNACSTFCKVCPDGACIDDVVAIAVAYCLEQ
jgi:hypothetical protein